MELPFAAVQQLCSPFLDLMERLAAAPARRARRRVRTDCGPGPAPDRFLVGLAVLGLLAEAAEEQPLVCAVDDAQWLDSASARTLAFVARRLVAEKIALVFATRELGETLAGLPELHVAPLERRDARALLESVLPARLDERVLERIVAETRGNPLALLELPRGLSPTQLAGGFGLPTTAPLSAGIEDRYTRRLARLPSDARRLLLVAAADPVGDPALVWRAAERLGIPESAAETVESEQLLALSPRVVFRHPLVRSAVYGSAEPNERREVHRALAEATDPEIDPDRRAWHRAQAAATPDEEVAAELERSAARAQARGGLAAAAAFLERAVALSPEPTRRARRALVAAETKFQPALSTTPSIFWRPPSQALLSTIFCVPTRTCCVLRSRSPRGEVATRPATARGRARTRGGRSQPRTSDLPGGPVCGDVRRPPGPRRRRGRDQRGRARRSAAAREAAAV